MELEERIGYSFKNKNLLKTALTHSSYSNEKKVGHFGCNERLEFLGDAVLELTSSEFLFLNYKDMPEGELTKLRASIVCEPTLALCAREISLGDYLMLGKGENMTGGRKRPSVVSDAFEAVIGAIYLDGGLEAARAFVYRFVMSDIETKKLFYDSKTILQEKVQQKYHIEVTYRLDGEEGPDHDKRFFVSAMVEDRVIGAGEGRTKKAAEQEAAYDALKKGQAL